MRVVLGGRTLVVSIGGTRCSTGASARWRVCSMDPVAECSRFDGRRKGERGGGEGGEERESGSGGEDGSEPARDSGESTRRTEAGTTGTASSIGTAWEWGSGRDEGGGISMDDDLGKNSNAGTRDRNRGWGRYTRRPAVGFASARSNSSMNRETRG